MTADLEIDTRALTAEYLDATLQASANGSTSVDLDVPLRDRPARSIRDALRGLIAEVNGPVTVGMLKTALASDKDAVRFLGEVLTAGGIVSALPTYAAQLREQERRREIWRAADEAKAKVLEGDVAAAEELLQKALVARAPSGRRRFLGVADLRSLPRPEEVVEHFIRARGLNAIVGPMASFKSFLVLDLSLCIVAGLPWFGDRAVRPGAVVYAPSEGAEGMADRVDAWVAQNASADLAGFHVTDPVHLLDARDVSELIAGARPLAPSLVVVDTLARSMIGADENSAKDMGIAIAGLDRIRTELDTAVVAVHHTGWDTSRERGSTALRAAADSLLMVKASGDSITVESVKQRDAEDAPPLYLTRRVVGIPGRAHPDGRPVTSVVLEQGAGVISENSTRLLEILRDADLGEGLTASQWERLAVESKVSRAAFYRGVRELKESKQVSQIGLKRGARYRAADQQELDLDA